MSQQITIRFYQELDDFLTQDKRATDFNVELKEARAIKDLIESIGIPHTEVDLNIDNNISDDFNHQVQADDQISV